MSVRFGGIVALDGVSFDVAPGQIAGLIGPNGAGKTTLFNCLSPALHPQRGRHPVRGPLDPAPSRRHAIPKLGIGRTFQNVALFDRMSVLDNVKVGCHSRTAHRLHHQRAAPARGRQPEERRITERARELVAFMDLEAVRARAGAAGCRSRCASASSSPARSPAARSCCCSTSRPPASTTTRSTCCAGRSGACATPQHVTVLLVEHHMSLVMSVSDKVVAIDFGRKIAEGTPARGAEATRT